MKLLLKIGGAVIALVVLALVTVNMLISADAVRDRVAARVKAQTGRDLTVHGSSSLLLMPSPHIVLTDVEITDPKNRTGADLTVARLALDVSFGQLFSRQVDADRVVMERPVLTVRLNDSAQQEGDAGPFAPMAPTRAAAAAPFRFIAAEAGGGSSRRDVMLKDVRIEDGTVRIIYNADGAERRVEHIDASLSLTHLVDPLTAKGDFDWKGLRVGFDLKLVSPADLETRSARLDLALDTDAIDASFGGNVAAKPAFSAEGDLAVKSQSVPSVLAWMRQQPSSVTAVGSGELNSHVAWQQGEISFTQTRFALSHATGQGQAVVTLKSPRPYLRAAFALETLDLNPFFASAPGASGETAAAAQPSGAAEHVQRKSGQAADGVSAPESSSDVAAEAPPTEAPLAESAPAPQAPDGAPAQVANVMPAAFDADVNVNIRETKVARLTIGPSSLGLSLRDGVLDANLSDMQLYDGQGKGKLTLDASRPVPAFSSHVELDNVSLQPLLAGAAGFNLLAGRAKVELKLNGSGRTGDEIKHSLAGDSTIDITDGAIEGINLTELIAGIGAGKMPELDQGPGAKTTFSNLSGTFTIASGVAESHDLEMAASLLQVTARGTVDVVTGSVDFLTQPEIVAGPEGKSGANPLAGLSVPVRIEGPFAHPSFRPEIKGLFSSPEQASKTVNQIGEILQKNLKGKPVGEAIGRMLGNIRIGGNRGNHDDGGAAAPPRRAEPEAEPEPESDEPRDPDLQEILR